MILVIGGDLRQVYAAQKLAGENTVEIMGFNKNVSIPQGILERSLNKADVIVLPLPMSTDGINVNAPLSSSTIPLSLIPSLLKEGGVILGGKIDEKVHKEYFSDIKTIDYLNREELNILNAVPTAEGAVQLAMEEIPETIFRQKILILGYGRIAKVLSKILNGMGADITVSVRKYSDMAWAEVYNCKTFPLENLPQNISKFKLIFNTIPSMILDEGILKKIGSDSLIIDLASKPGGVDMTAAQNYGKKVVWALSLPSNIVVDR